MTVTRHPRNPVDVGVTPVSYDTIETSLRSLREAVEAAIKADESEATSFWSEVKSLFRDGTAYFERKTQFDEQAGRVKEQARNLVADAETLCTKHYKPLGHVPEQLEADGERWFETRREISAMRDKARDLVTIPGWEGGASTAYASTVTVQVNALSELAGVAQSLAQSCWSGALLNRFLFLDIRTTIDTARDRFPQGASQVGDCYYMRTARAVAFLRAMISNLQPDNVRKSAEGRVKELQRQLRSTKTMPAVIEPGRWPGDGSRAGIAPADTARGVTGAGPGIRARGTSIAQCVAGISR